jgi:hypothetical protein
MWSLLLVVAWNITTEPLSSNRHLCCAFLNSHFRLSGRISHYVTELWVCRTLGLPYLRRLRRIGCNFHDGFYTYPISPMTVRASLYIHLPNASILFFLTHQSQSQYFISHYYWICDTPHAEFSQFTQITSLTHIIISSSDISIISFVWLGSSGLFLWIPIRSHIQYYIHI